MSRNFKKHPLISYKIRPSVLKMLHSLQQKKRKIRGHFGSLHISYLLLEVHCMVFLRLVCVNLTNFSRQIRKSSIVKKHSYFNTIHNFDYWCFLDSESQMILKFAKTLKKLQQKIVFIFCSL